MSKPIVQQTHANPTASIIWLHGLGADGHDFANIIPELQLPQDLGIRFIFPHAPIRPVSVNQNMPMRAWFNIYSLNNLEQEDHHGLAEADQYLQSLIQQELVAGIPSERIILAGFSQGGAVAFYTGLQYPKPLGGIIGLSTFLPRSQFIAEAVQSSSHAAVFLAHGDYDDMVSPLASVKCRDFLQKLGCSVEWHTYPMAHQVCAQEIKDLSQWIQQRLR